MAVDPLTAPEMAKCLERALDSFYTIMNVSQVSLDFSPSDHQGEHGSTCPKCLAHARLVTLRAVAEGQVNTIKPTLFRALGQKS